MSCPIQRLIMPNLVFGAPEEMYARLGNDKAHALMSEGKLLFDIGGRVSLDTFFNAVTVGVWKTHTQIADLQLHLRGTGRFILRLGMRRIGHAHRWLAEKIVVLTPGQEQSIEVEAWAKLESGMLYFTLEALEPGSLTGGYFATRTVPQREAKLGVVITHFNRKQWVLPAIARIHDELLSDPLYKDRIELVVVDNSQNITADEAQGITLIPNKNLGGSGGFTRGLLHLKDRQDFTHCLFMDDDASCEVESIRRAYTLLCYFSDSRLTLAGALLRELEPFRLFEKGAVFNGLCKPLKNGLDMCSVHDLLIAEVRDVRPSYGGWWFFAFSLSAVRAYPFPFFVRGDDIRFSIDNEFDIITLNGIACWGEDFSLKSGPLPLYLDVRHQTIAFLTKFDQGRLRLMSMVARFTLGQLFGYNYASAKACVMALEDVLKGPQFFQQNMDTAEIRKKVGQLRPLEKLEPKQRADFDLSYVGPTESMLRRFMRGITLNGFLLPGFLLQKRTVFQNKKFRASFREVFRSTAVYYEHEPSGTAYTAQHDKKLFFSVLFALLKNCAKMLFAFGRVRSEFMNNWGAMTNEEFWRNAMGLEKR